ncbi:glycosyltransferase family 25 protein [Niveispirillum sp. KHB5.9]|uniref:glycosyltransferase family 25 protein n=1 Tax=Niveispirillum sp. KHB5.9 TaxID=3400269 RepID=UPI003A85205E
MAKFELFYINLDSAPERRETLEASYAKAGFSDNWTLNRFAAYSKDSPEVLSNAGKQNGPYKGNFASHYDCLKSQLNSDAHTMICEDDCDFAPGCGDYIEQMIDNLPPDKWDILLTEVTFLSAFELPVFLKMKEQECKKRLHLIKLGQLEYAFTGSTSYIVNKASRHKVMEVFADQRAVIDFPFDICLRAAVYHEQLQGLLVFPFITAPSRHADFTQAPFLSLTGSAQAVHQFHMEAMNCSRRMLSIHYDPANAISPQILAACEQYEYDQEEKVARNVIYWMQLMQQKSYYKEFLHVPVVDFGLDLPPSATDRD